MRLIEVQVMFFRNILDSSPMKVEPDVTCLVGKNESGKTAFLHALYRLNPSRSGTFSISSHYPAWLEKRDRMRGIDLAKVVPIKARFILGEREVKEIEQIFGSGSLGSNELVLTRDYSGSLVYDLSVDEAAIVRHFLSAVTVPQKIATEARQHKTVADFGEFVQHACSRENVSAESKAALQRVYENMRKAAGQQGLRFAICERIKPFVPQFFYFDKYSTLPYSADIRRLLKDPESQLDEGQITARALLRLAAADDDYLINPDYERRKRELENVANALTDDILTYWSQNPSLRVLPDVTLTTQQNPQGQQAVVNELKLRIWDERHLLSLPFNEHSSGFQWFFSFLAAFSDFESRQTPVVILLDEPALGLHAKAQKDYLRFIEERLAPRCQVLYTTHSPFMVQPAKLERVRIVEDRGRDEGAKVSSEVLTTDPDTLFPLQGALGYDMAQHLFIAPHNLVVEGTSDFTYLTVLSEYLRTQPGRAALDERWSIVPVGGADLIPTFVALLGNHLDVTVLIDSHKAGHQKLSRLASQGYLIEKRIVAVGEILGRRAADIEDLFATSDYLRLYNLAFSQDVRENDLSGEDTVLLRVARCQQVGDFDHGKPAEVLLRQRDSLLPQMTPETMANFERLFVRLNATLN